MAVQAAELRLNLGLDLKFFRQQLQKAANIAASEFTPSINIRINRATLDRELNNLQRSLKRRSYRIELKTNLKSEAEYAERIAAAAPALERAAAAFKVIGKGNKDVASVLSKQERIAQSISKALAKTEAKGGASAAQVEALYRKAYEAKLSGITGNAGTKAARSQELGKAFAAMSVNAVSSFLDEFQKGKSKGKQSGIALGESVLKGIKTSMEIASPSKKMKELGRNASEGFVLGLNEGLDDIEKYARRVKAILDGVAKEIATTGKTVANIQGKRLGLSNLPLMTRSLEAKGEKIAGTIGGAGNLDDLRALYPEVRRSIASLSALRTQVDRNASKLSGFSLIIGIAAFAGVPLAKNIVKLTDSAGAFSKLLDKLGDKLEDAVVKAATQLLRGTSGRNIGGRGPFGLLPPAYRGIGPAAEPNIAGLLEGRGGPAGLLPPAYRGLAGTAFPQKFLPPNISGELQEILKKAAYAFSNTVVAEYKKQIRNVTVQDLGTKQNLLRGTNIAGLLSAGSTGRYATGSLGRMYGEGFTETKAEMFARRIEQAFARSAERAADILERRGNLLAPAPPLMLPPAGGSSYRPGGGYVPPGGFPVDQPQWPSRPIWKGADGPATELGKGYYGITKTFNEIEKAVQSLSNQKIPFTGVFKELGSEAIFATKQLILFGTAYKALAFLQNFPRQVGEAVAQLQSFRNALSAVSPSAQEAANSTAFILDVVNRYNVPLKTARDSFVKLYASMQPAGFQGDQIRGLFEGVSKAAATFGMSADQVNRVNYAFAQMASKGQVMSEELKGQLGDVLPGAVAIFAQAAGFKGPEAIKNFSAELEKGSYKGKAMVELLNNVSVLMNTKFAAGAAGAANTFQGAMNKIQNSLQKLYESFEPVAGAFLGAFVKPISQGIEALSDGLNAFFTGAATKTAGGFAIAKELEALRPVFEGIKTNAKGLIDVFAGLAKIALELGKALIIIASNPIVGYLARLLAASLPLIAAYAGIRAAILALVPALTMARTFLIQFIVQLAAGQTALNATSLAAKSAGISIRAAFASTAIGLVIVGLSMIIEKLFSMNMELEKTKEKAMNASQAIRSMSQTEARSAAQSYTRQAKSLEQLNKAIESGGLGKFKSAYSTGTDIKIEVTPQQAQALKAAGITPEENNGRYSVDPTLITGAYQKIKSLEAEALYRERQLKFESNQPPPTFSVPSAGAAGGGTSGKPGAEKIPPTGILAAQLKDNVQALSDLLEAETQSALATIELKFGRGVGVFEPFLDAYEKIIQFNDKVGKGALEQLKLQAENIPQEIKAGQAAVKYGKALNPRVGSSFAGFPVTDVPGSPRTYRNGTHEGFDIGTPIGTKISYAVGGIVKSIDKVGKGNAGKLLEVQLENGIVGLSMHLSDVLVEVGQKFQAGQVLALTGDTGAGPAHLHQESAARAYKQGQAGASLSYLQLNGRSATGAAGVLPSPAEVAATNAQEMMAKQKVIAASLSKEAAAVFNALMNLNEVDITSKVNQDIFDLTQTLKDLRRESEDAWDDFVPENAITEGRKRIKALNRQIEDIPNKYRDISIKIEQSFRGRELAKVFGDKKFLDSTAVKNLKTELAGLGISTETIDKAFTDAAKSGGTLETALENLKTAIPALAQAELDRLKLSLEIAVEFEPKKAALATRASIESAWGLQDPATANAQERLRLDEDIARAKAALNEAEKGADQDAIKRSQEVVNSLKAQRLAYTDLIPGVITYAELLQTAFQPAVNAFTDFVTGAKSAGEAFRSFASEVVQGLIRIMVQAATMMVFKQIIGGLGALFGVNSGNSSGNVLEFLLGGPRGFANGGVAEGGFQAFANGGIAPGGIKFRAFAGGGTVKGPTMGLVGEGRYNEAIVPLPDGKSIPVIMKGAGGEAGDNFNVNVSVDASGSKVEGDSGKAKELGQVLSTAIQAELIKQKRPGGLLA